MYRRKNRIPLQRWSRLIKSDTKQLITEPWRLLDFWNAPKLLFSFLQNNNKMVWIVLMHKSMLLKKTELQFFLLLQMFFQNTLQCSCIQVFFFFFYLYLLSSDTNTPLSPCLVSRETAIQRSLPTPYKRRPPHPVVCLHTVFTSHVWSCWALDHQVEWSQWLWYTKPLFSTFWLFLVPLYFRFYQIVCSCYVLFWFSDLLIFSLNILNQLLCSQVFIWWNDLFLLLTLLQISELFCLVLQLSSAAKVQWPVQKMWLSHWLWAQEHKPWTDGAFLMTST